ncbi:delta-60 repeat domain-containing protein [Azotobacter salinestris]|uniref:delta-60 repeat domain-containing protein n=1 Tax=Azotobacter salinestris TaxID=69964 RepID=UPI0032DE5F6B
MATSISANTAPSFGLRSASGKLVVDVDGLNDYGYALALQPDGQILLAGRSYSIASKSYDFGVIRLNADGTLDTGFDGDGKAAFDIDRSFDEARSLSVLPDGRILVTGYSVTSSNNTDFSLIRLNADGTLDTGFGDAGQVVVDIGGGGDQDSAYDLAVQPDGKILLAGESHSNFTVIRLNADGTLDSGFGTDGKVADLGGSQSNGMTLQPDGRILLVGSAYNASSANFDFNVMRLNADGTLDTSFGTDGKVTFDGGGHEYGNDLIVQPDGKILAAGISFVDTSATSTPSNNFRVIRLNADGTLDTGFSEDGEVIVDVARHHDFGFSMALQPDGRILVAGMSRVSGDPNSNYNFSVVRLNADGTLDTSFSDDGKATFDVGGSYDESRSLTVQPDGKILLAGSSYNPGSGNYDFSVIRLNTDGTLDTSFGSPTGSPSSLGGTVHYTEGAAPVLLDASVAIFDAELAALDGGAGNYAGASIILSRQGGPSPEDLFFALGDLAFSDGTAVLSGVTVGSVGQADGTLSIVFNANASQARVDEVLSSIGYANTADAPPDSIRIDWTFRDGSGSDALSVTDGTTVHLLNTNDAPTVELPLRVAANEDDAAFTVDLLAGASDPDGDSLEVIDAGLLPGGITLSGSLLTVDPGHIGFQRLAAGATREILVDYRISDGTDSIGQILSLSIQGTNDTPTVEMPLWVTASEDDAAFTVDLLAGASDPDGDSLEVIDIGLLPGGITLSGNLLTVDPGHAAFQHLAAGATREILVDYRIGDGIDSIGQILGLSIRGVNDAPRTSAVSLSGVENAPLLIPLVEDYVRDPDAGSQLHIGTVTAIDYAWAGDTASTALTHPITGQAISLDALAGTTAVSSDGKSLLLSPASELEWMSAGQKITATVHYSVEDERGPPRPAALP